MTVSVLRCYRVICATACSCDWDTAINSEFLGRGSPIKADFIGITHFFTPIRENPHQHCFLAFKAGASTNPTNMLCQLRWGKLSLHKRIIWMQLAQFNCSRPAEVSKKCFPNESIYFFSIINRQHTYNSSPYDLLIGHFIQGFD